MIDNNTIPADQVSFKYFLLKNKRNRMTLILAAIVIIIQFAVFKYFYPFASFIHGDSFVYIETASKNLDINTYMVGYSKFLRLFSVFTNSDTALVAFQYLLLQSSALFFLFTLFYFYNPSNEVQIVLLFFMLLNPLFLYIANLVSSDCFFLALSLTWFNLMLWIIHQHSTRVILWHTIIIFIAFMVRYNALIYPLIAVLAFGLSNMPIRKKITGIAAGALLCGLFVLYTSNRYKSLTGIWQYSPFSGWQMTNNAMYAYRYVDSAKRKPVPARFKVLDNMIREYFDSTRDVKKYPQEEWMASTVYMWDPRSSLYKYRNLQYTNDSTSSELKRWASIGPFYADYGAYIIKQYPLYYARYFLWPNATKYYAPPVEFLETYNSGKDSVISIAKTWFGYKSKKVTTRVKDLNISTLNFYPILTGVMNVVLLCSLACFIMLNGFRNNSPIRKGLLLGTSIWLINAGFTIFASSAALRFQAFPIMLVCTFALLLIDCLWRLAVSMESSKQKIESPEF